MMGGPPLEEFFNLLHRSINLQKLKDIIDENYKRNPACLGNTLA